MNRLGYARVSHGGLSDTEVQIGRFRIPQEGSTVSDNDHITIDPQRVESEVLFNPVLVLVFMFITVHYITVQSCVSK